MQDRDVIVRPIKDLLAIVAALLLLTAIGWLSQGDVLVFMLGLAAMFAMGGALASRRR